MELHNSFTDVFNKKETEGMFLYLLFREKRVTYIKKLLKRFNIPISELKHLTTWIFENDNEPLKENIKFPLLINIF